MKNVYTTSLNLQNTDFGLLLFRLFIGGLMLTHGVPKLLTFFGDGEIVFADPIGIGETVTFTFAVFAEFVCAILIIFGWATRFAAIPLIITMAVAAIIVHWTDGFGRQELPLLYMGGFLLLFFTGAGKFSLDYYLLKKN
ncbi:putative oxidoreductase [Salegentibacter holothuriorum]|uniref:Putative oxidoreductase n=1 Tax=Salegentibacter holothuriorum TaxID=241145 RepID=A0A1T5AED3_9FLAO|nr:DoxX family protein [Salegentibacter holothuriorum]SKB33280.1 putative oxidoreductase [Salegentibacter holothuriorum]